MVVKSPRAEGGGDGQDAAMWRTADGSWGLWDRDSAQGEVGWGGTGAALHMPAREVVG